MSYITRLKLIVTFLHFKDLTKNQDQDITRQLNQMKHMNVDKRHWIVESHSHFVLAEQYMYQVGCVYESITILTIYCAGWQDIPGKNSQIKRSENEACCLTSGMNQGFWSYLTCP